MWWTCFLKTELWFVVVRILEPGVGRVVVLGIHLDTRRIQGRGTSFGELALVERGSGWWGLVVVSVLCVVRVVLTRVRELSASHLVRAASQARIAPRVWLVLRCLLGWFGLIAWAWFARVRTLEQEVGAGAGTEWPGNEGALAGSSLSPG